MHTDGKFVLSGGFDSIVGLYDIEQLCCVKTLSGHTAAITSVECTRYIIILIFYYI
jgi:WD40 repeat protein